MRRQPLKVWILIFVNLQSQCRLWRSLGERLIYDLEKAANSKTGSQAIRLFWTGMFWTVTALVPDKLKGVFYAVSSIPISNADCELAFSFSLSLSFFFFWIELDLHPKSIPLCTHPLDHIYSFWRVNSVPSCGWPKDIKTPQTSAV